LLLPDRVTRRSTADDDDDDAGASTDASLRPDVDTINAAPDTTRPTDTNDTNRLRFFGAAADADAGCSTAVNASMSDDCICFSFPSSFLCGTCVR